MQCFKLYVSVFLGLLHTKSIYAAVGGSQGNANLRTLVFEMNAFPVAFLPAVFSRICTNDRFYHLFESLVDELNNLEAMLIKT